jgi:hypothetical protein
MELFRNTRLKIGRSVLNKKLARVSRKLSYSGFDAVKKIGIVWDASNTSEFAALSRFCQKMNERNIDVKIFGYFNGKNLPDQYTAIRYLTCIRNHEISFFYLPLSSEATSFISNGFDILIDINFNKILPLTYISSLSAALFKVGLFESDSEEKHFDLMMEMKYPVDVDNFLTQTLQYLEMINPGTVKPEN